MSEQDLSCLVFFHIRLYTDYMNVDIMNKDRFPFSYQLELLGGVNTEEGGLFAMKYDKEIREEQNELIENIFHRGAAFGRDGAKKIHILDGI